MPVLEYSTNKMQPEQGQVTQLLTKFKGGDHGAESELIPLIQPDLRRIAGVLMRNESPGVTLQATVLVNDVLMKLLYGAPVDWQSRAHFFAIAAKQMRYILIDHARAAKALKRVTSGQRVPLDAITLIAQGRHHDLLEIDEALTQLAAEYPEQAKVVEMRVFGGYGNGDIAEVLGTSERTVKRHWAFAKAWLHRKLRGGTNEDATPS